jgi:3-oxoacyl-[acyl-carrier-protein] synthase-1
MSPLAIRASGMVTAVGFNAETTCAALRAGIRNVAQTNLWDPLSATLLPAGKVPLPQWSPGIEKLADLAAAAIYQCFEAAAPTPPGDIPVLLGIAPLERPYQQPEWLHDLVPAIEDRLGFRLNSASRLMASDHVSVVVGIRLAADMIAGRRATFVIVGGVDSLLHQELKTHYLTQRRLLTPDNSNGFSLGEGAGALLLSSSGATDGELLIRGTGLSREPATIESDESLRGDGLTAAIREALSQEGLTYRDLDYRITDLNGEHYKFKEMLLAMMRFDREPKAKLFDLWHPIEFMGDVGAAIGPIVLGFALHAARKRYAVGPTALTTFGNDSGERAAVVVSYGE